MAERPVFTPAPEERPFVRAVCFQLEWNGGFAASQKKKNVDALHQAAAREGLAPLLEISTKSEEKLGRHLSAFHLKVRVGEIALSLESVFQGSKVFEGGGPFTDLYMVDARTAKRDERLRSSGNVVGFELAGVSFPSEPKTMFYDWLYISALFEHREWLMDRLPKYAGFTDIEFNPSRSVNCQARSCALLVALAKSNLLETAMSSPLRFAEVVSPSEREASKARESPLRAGRS
jgi:hypothetical protein